MDETASLGAKSRSASGRGSIYFAAIVAVITIALIPAVANSFWLRVLTSSAIYSLAAIGVALLFARLGLVSLAQVALVGVGGWVTLRLYFWLGLPFEINVLLGGAITGLIGLIVGLPAVRMRGLYLALVTLMFASGFQILVTAVQFPNGAAGFMGFSFVTGEFMPRPVIATSDAAFFRYAAIVTILGFLLVELHRRTRPGRAWAFIRKSEACAMAAGVNVTLYKTWAFTLAGFLAGIAGGLLAGSLGVLDARTFPVQESVFLFALVIVGGVYSWAGVVLSGLLFRGAPALLNSWGIDGDIAFAIFGVALLHAIITAPTGLAGQSQQMLAMMIKKLRSS